MRGLRRAVPQVPSRPGAAFPQGPRGAAPRTTPWLPSCGGRRGPELFISLRCSHWPQVRPRPGYLGLGWERVPLHLTRASTSLPALRGGSSVHLNFNTQEGRAVPARAARPGRGASRTRALPEPGRGVRAGGGDLGRCWRGSVLGVRPGASAFDSLRRFPREEGSLLSVQTPGLQV